MIFGRVIQSSGQGSVSHARLVTPPYFLFKLSPLIDDNIWLDYISCQDDVSHLKLVEALSPASYPIY